MNNISDDAMRELQRRIIALETALAQMIARHADDDSPAAAAARATLNDKLPIGAMYLSPDAIKHLKTDCIIDVVMGVSPQTILVPNEKIAVWSDGEDGQPVNVDCGGTVLVRAVALCRDQSDTAPELWRITLALMET